MDTTQMYRVVQASMIEICSGLSTDEAATAVPTCPDWTVKDVLAHVVGIGADFQEGTREGAGSDAWTAAQVDKRVDKSIGQILAEWEDLADFLDEFYAANPDMAEALVADLVTHEHDVRLALGQPGNRAGAAVTASAERYADRFLDRVAESERPPAAVVIDGERRGPDEADAVLEGEAFDLLRAFTGRRNLEQIAALNWDGDPGGYLEIISAYGAASAIGIQE